MFGNHYFGVRYYGDPYFGPREAVQLSGGYGFFDFEAVRVKHFKPKTKKEKKAAPVINDIIEQADPTYDNTDLEIILRLRLRQRDLEYQDKYLAFLKTQLAYKKMLIKKRQREEETLLLLT